MLANIAGKSAEEVEILRQSGTFIGNLAKNNTLYLVGFVIPLFIVLAANIVGLVIYVKKQTKKDPVKVTDLSEEQKEALRKELLKDLQDK